jgi:hypothetical protein
VSHESSQTVARPDRSRSTIGQLLWTTFVVAVILGFLREPVQVILLIVPAVYAAILVRPWITDAIRLKRSLWSSADPPYQPFDPQAGDIPDWVVETIRRVVPQLEELGFTTLGHFALDGAIPDCTSFISLFENRRTRQLAKHLAVIGSASNSQVMTTVLAFLTEFADGTKLITSNHAMRALEPQPAVREGSMSFPRVRNPRHLFEIHNASVARYASEAIRVERAIVNPTEFLRTVRREQAARHVESGYSYFDEESRRYHPTWKGAILMAWKLWRPIKRIRDWSLRRRAARMLRELGLAHLAPEGQELDRIPQSR